MKLRTLLAAATMLHTAPALAAIDPPAASRLDGRMRVVPYSRSNPVQLYAAPGASLRIQLGADEEVVQIVVSDQATITPEEEAPGAALTVSSTLGNPAPAQKGPASCDPNLCRSVAGNFVYLKPLRALDPQPLFIQTKRCAPEAGRVLFLLDEAVLLGRDPSLKIARDQGRKSKITLQLFYQSEGQIEEVWGAGGKKAWFDGLSWRTYAGVQNLDSARELTAMLGTFGARAISSGSNKGRSGRPMELVQSGSRGTNTNEHEISRELAKPDELLADMRDDERITLVRNQRPMRHGAAIGFRRPEIAVVLGQTSYRRQVLPAAAE